MIRIKNLTRGKADIRCLESVAKAVLRGEKASESAEVSIVLLGEKRMRRINKENRGEDRPTDVLSFSFSEDKKSKFPIELLGEVVICPVIVRREAKKRGESFRKGLIRTLVHGLLHVLGYNHEKEKDFLKMRKREEHYISRTY